MKWLANTVHQSGVPVSFVNIWDSNSGGQYRFTSSADHKPLEAAWARYFGDPPTSMSSSASLPTSKSATVTTDSPQAPVVAVADPLPAAAPIPTSPGQAGLADQSSGSGLGHGWPSQFGDSMAHGDMATPAVRTNMELADQSFALLRPIGDLVADRGGPTTLSAPITAADATHADGSTISFLASHGFALLNQYLAGHGGRVDPGQIVAVEPNRATWAQDSILPRPRH